MFSKVFKTTTEIGEVKISDRTGNPPWPYTLCSLDSNTYTITLNPKGETGGTSSVTVTYGSAMPSGNTAPTKTGYIFDGYYLQENGEESNGGAGIVIMRNKR